jgi:sugar phosphate permease
MWILSLMYFCYAYPLGIYLDWFPKYLNAERGFSLEKMGFYASLPLFAAVLGDLSGGWISDIWARHSDLRTARKRVAIVGFLAAGAGMLASCLAANAVVSVAWSCAAMFGLELTVGVAWAVPLDIGGDYAGSVSAVMNSFGNMGGAVATTASGYLVKYFGWPSTFFAMSAMAFIAAALFTRIDAGRRIC